MQSVFLLNNPTPPLPPSLRCASRIFDLTDANPDGRRGEASIDKRYEEGNTIIFGMLRPYQIYNNNHVNGIKKVRVCQCL